MPNTDQNITIDATSEFGRPLNLNDSVFENNFTRLETIDGHKRVVADFEQYECKSIHVEELATDGDDLSDWEEIKKETPEAKANRLQEERSFLQKFASGEYLAHHLPYQDLSSKKTIRVLEENGSHRQYTVQKLRTNHNGLVGYILVPTTAATDPTLDLKVIFQGTASLAAVARDVFESGGAGSETFEENKIEFLSQLNEVVAQFKKPTNVTLTGHSLGSADAQNGMGGVMEAIAQNNGMKATTDNTIPASSRTHLGKIQQLKLFGCNSPGITQANNERAKKIAKFFHKKKLPIELECNYLRIHKDGVQQTGETTLLDGVLPQYAKVNVMKATSLEKYSYSELAQRALLVGGMTALGVVTAPVLSVGITTGLVLGATTVGLINTADAHTQHVFNPNAPARFSYERYSNQDLSKNSKLDVKKSTALNTAHKGLLTVLNKFKGIGDLFKKPSKSDAKPVLFSPVAQAVGHAKLNVEKPPVVVESPKAQKQWWKNLF